MLFARELGANELLEHVVEPERELALNADVGGDAARIEALAGERVEALEEIERLLIQKLADHDHRHIDGRIEVEEQLVRPLRRGSHVVARPPTVLEHVVRRLFVVDDAE